MPPVKIVFFADSKGKAPVYEWLEDLSRRIRAKGFARILRLAEKGHELRRPEADYLQKDIYELRWKWQKVNYRILYFFRFKEIVVLAHGFTKEGKISSRDLETAMKRRELYMTDPIRYTFKMEIEHD